VGHVAEREHLDRQFTEYFGRFEDWRNLPEEKKDSALSWLGPTDNEEAIFVYFEMWPEYLRMQEEAAELAEFAVPAAPPIEL
jgi:hypothetical protein